MIRVLIIVCTLLLSSICTKAQSPDTAKSDKEFPLSGSVQLSGMFKSGDVNASNVASDVVIQTSTGPVKHSALYDYKRVSQKQAGQKVEYTVHEVEYQMSFAVVNTLQGMVGGTFEKNDIRQINSRFIGYAGLRMPLVQSQKVNIVHTAAGGYGDQQFGSGLNDLHQDFPIFYTGNNFTWHITETAQFTNSINYIAEFISQTEHRLLGETSIKSQLSKVLAFTLKFDYDFSSRTDFLDVSRQPDSWNVTFTGGLQAKF